MSPRAAWRLESLGFTQVFYYVAGKADWLANGLPVEGKLKSVPRIGAAARRDVPTCRLTDRVGAVRERVRAAGWDRCIVVGEAGVVLGLLRGKALDVDPETPAESVMQEGPSTFRPNLTVAEMAEYMQERRIGHALVTTSDGKLVGVLVRQDAERLLTTLAATADKKLVDQPARS